MRFNNKPTPCQFDSANPRKHSAAFAIILPIMEQMARQSATGEFTIEPEKLSKLAGGFYTGSISPAGADGLLDFLVWIGTLEEVKEGSPTYQFSKDYTVTVGQRSI